MTRFAALLLALAAVAECGEEVIARFRLKRDPLAQLSGYVSDWTDAEFRFRQIGPGTPTVTVKWDDLVAEDAQALRVKFKLDLTEDERLGLIPGHRLHFVGGGSEDGLLLRVDDDGRHYLKVRRLVLPYEKDRVERVEEIKVPEADVYDEDELYTVRLQRIPPKTGREHKDLAEYLFAAGYFDKARKHFEDAIAADASLADAIAPRMQELKELATDAEFDAARREAGYRANILDDFDRAISILAAYREKHPERERSVVRVLREIDERRTQKYQERFNYLKHRALEFHVRRYLERQKPDDLQTALSWVTAKLPEEIEKSLRANMNLNDEDFKRFRENKGKGALHFATYGNGSFVFSGKAKKGKSTPKEIRGDPNSWWQMLVDVQSRSTFLKAYAAEKLPDYFEVNSVRVTQCTACGGTGQVKKTSSTEVKGVGHEWWETCRRCYGACDDRALAFR